MRIVGGARNGYCSKLSPIRDFTPSIKIRIEMTIATIGRRMKKPAMGSVPPARGRRRLLARRCWRLAWLRRLFCGRVGDDLHLDAGPHLLQSLDDHALVALEAR